MIHQKSILVVAVLSGFIGSAFGQNALGDGRGLDNNLSTESRYNRSRPSLADEMRFRNSIVTGNAIGGLSFRGDVGYRAPGEFSGDLGSNDLFAFRRDSLSSGLAGMGIRGSEALQLQFALTTGGRPPQNLVGTYSLSRDGVSSYTPRRGVSDFDSSQSLQRSLPQVEDVNSPFMGALRASSAYEANRGYQPMLLGIEPPSEGEAGRYGLTASELRGVGRTELYVPEEGLESRLNMAIAPERFETSYTKMMERIREQAALLPVPKTDVPADTRSPWEIRLQELQLQLLNPSEEPVLPEGDPEATVPEKARFDADTLGLLRGGGDPADRFVSADLEGAYAVHMRKGEVYLRDGRYFDAEERFAHALTTRPNDTTAQIGRIHAQIGAGMYLSAAINLRTLMMEQPTMISARFDEALMPSDERLGAILESLRSGIAAAGVESPKSGDLRRARAAGLLLAYIGIQSGDGMMVTEGVRAARAAIDRSRSRGDDVANASERRLLDLIEAVWVDRQP